MLRTISAAILSALLLAVSVPGATADDASAGAVVDFQRHDLDGRALRLSDYRGQWVVVNFWATWCGPCLREIPMLREVDGGRDDVTVIGVNFEEIDPDLLRDFVQSMGIEYPVVRAGSEPVVPFEPLKGLPSTFIVSPEGRLVAARVGEVERGWIEARIVAGESPADAIR